MIATTVPHAGNGKPDYSGALNVIIGGETADIICNQCSSVVRTVSVVALQAVLNELNRYADPVQP